MVARDLLRSMPRCSRAASLRPRIASTLVFAIALAIGCGESGLGAAPRIASLPVPDRPDAPESWKPHYAALSALGDGFVTWESRRGGKWRIWARPLDGGPERQISPDEPGRDHIGAHISPDGRHVVYLSLPAPHDDFDQLPPAVKAPLHLLRLDGLDRVEDRVLVPSARSYQQSRVALWVNPRELIYLGPDGTTRQLDIASGAERMLIAKNTRYGLLVNATHTHATNGNPTFSIYHEGDGTVSRRDRLSGCQPYFTPDGRLGYWMSGSGGPISKLDLVDGTSTAVIERGSDRLPKGRGYIYYPMASADQRLLAFGASRGKHGHFAADFDIYVAPLDPDRFEVIGPAVRYSFAPEIDRFPDVFVSGNELGRLRGEAPFEATFHLDPDAPPDGWRFDFGDGTPETSAATHRFEGPGRYRVVARRGERTLGGEVTVVAGVPPRLLRAEVMPGGREIAVAFDERIAIDQATARFESGAAIAGLAAGDGRELIVRLAEPFAGPDVLLVVGVADRAAVPYTIAPLRIPIESTSWPGIGEGLAFVFGTEGSNSSALDVDTGHARTFSLTPHARARYDAHGALRVAGGWFEAEELPDSLVAAFQKANAFTLELTIWPDVAYVEDTVRIVSFGFDAESQNFSLSQRGRRAELRLRNSRGGEKQQTVVKLVELKPGRPNHLIVAYRPGRLAVYKNGRRVLDDDAVQGDLTVWREGATLALGADPGGGRRFAGTLEGVALYTRLLEVEEAAAHAKAYRHLIASREPVKQVRVRARLAAASPLPTPQQIAPYREALVMNEYLVPPQRRAQLGERVRVAHWAVLDGQEQSLPEPKRRGRVPLLLEPFGSYRRLESAFVSDTLDPEPDVPLYLDVSN